MDKLELSYATAFVQAPLCDRVLAGENNFGDQTNKKNRKNKQVNNKTKTS